jgi:hypothetical protein
MHRIGMLTLLIGSLSWGTGCNGDKPTTDAVLDGNPIDPPAGCIKCAKSFTMDTSQSLQYLFEKKCKSCAGYWESICTIKGNPECLGPRDCPTSYNGQCGYPHPDGGRCTPLEACNP